MDIEEAFSEQIASANGDTMMLWMNEIDYNGRIKLKKFPYNKTDETTNTWAEGYTFLRMSEELKFVPICSIKEYTE